MGNIYKKRIENLVICSTLNQITNYLIINKYKPKRIFNITFDTKNINVMNINMKNSDWDEYLKKKCRQKFENEYKMEQPEFENIHLKQSQLYNLKDIKDVINDVINENLKGHEKESIYWHITGGQRIVSLAINEFIKNRDEDKLIYIEGNTETLIKLNNSGELVEGDEELDYSDDSLKIDDVLNLSGFKTKCELNSTNIYIGEGKAENFQIEHKFYNLLYDEIIKGNKYELSFDVNNEELKKLYKSDSGKDTFWNFLLNSNKIKNLENRKKFVENLFKKLINENDEFQKFQEVDEKHNILKLIENEINGSYPAGYIFEKVTAHKICKVIEDRKANKVISLVGSLKTYLGEKGEINDELDIVLMTNTGKIINFECKSGGMETNNAKSHNYTTYRLSGVFGIPILLSPLLGNESSPDNRKFERQHQALEAAKRAELKVIKIDEIESEIVKLLNLSD